MAGVMDGTVSKRQIRDAEVAQKQIRDAAEIGFSRHGLKGARISAIAKQAKIKTAMIHHYFENKEGLYRAVLQCPNGRESAVFRAVRT
jgi:TetR/AcrR family transcriptional regulator